MRAKGYQNSVHTTLYDFLHRKSFTILVDILARYTYRQPGVRLVMSNTRSQLCGFPSIRQVFSKSFPWDKLYIYYSGDKYNTSFAWYSFCHGHQHLHVSLFDMVVPWSRKWDDSGRLFLFFFSGLIISLI